MHEKLSRKARLGLPALAGALALSSCASPEPKPSTSVTCTELTLQKDPQTSTPNTYDAVVHWQQEPGPEANLMRFIFFNGDTATFFPVSGVTGQGQVLQLGSTEGHLSAFIVASIIDDANHVANCPVTPVDIPLGFAVQ
jgi:hypothetical protein